MRNGIISRQDVELLKAKLSKDDSSPRGSLPVFAFLSDIMEDGRAAKHWSSARSER